MSPTALYWAVVAITLAGFLLEVLLGWLDLRSSRKGASATVQSQYEVDRTVRRQAYLKEKFRLDTLSSLLVAAVVLSLFCSGAIASLDDLVRGFTQSPVLGTLAFFGMLFVLWMLVTVPLSAYETLVIDRKYSLGNTSARMFFLDTLKTLLLDLAVGVVLLCGGEWLYGLVGKNFWILLWGAYALLTVVVNALFPKLILPLFFHLDPLPDGELRSEVEEFSCKVGFSLGDIYVMDASRRSPLSNAFITGLGRRKSVVLFDNLVNRLPPRMIVGAISHEIGHWKRHHLSSRLLEMLSEALLVCLLFSLLVGSDALAAAAHCPAPSFRVNLTVSCVLLSPVIYVLSVLSNILSRRRERQADAFAKENGQGWNLSQALRKIFYSSFDNPTPHPLVVFLEHSHPPLYLRLSFLEEGQAPPQESVPPLSQGPETSLPDEAASPLRHEMQDHQEEEQSRDLCPLQDLVQDQNIEQTQCNESSNTESE